MQVALMLRLKFVSSLDGQYFTYLILFFVYSSVESDRDQLKEKLLNYLESIKEIQNWSPVKIEKFSEVDHVLVGCLLYTDEKVDYKLKKLNIIF
jgi:hypothetical protein